MENLRDLELEFQLKEIDLQIQHIELQIGSLNLEKDKLNYQKYILTTYEQEVESLLKGDVGPIDFNQLKKEADFNYTVTDLENVKVNYSELENDIKELKPRRLKK